MKFSNKIFSKFTLISTAIFLSACGGGSGSSATPDTKPQLFQSSFTSSLSIKENFNDDSKTYTIKNKSSNEKDSVLAYTITTELDNSLITEDSSFRITKFPQLNQLIDFDLGESAKGLKLEVEYNPILKKTSSIALIRASESPITEQKFYCGEESSSLSTDICTSAIVQYDANTGTANISFNQSVFRSFTTIITFTLNGQLKGSLSTPPQTIQNIPSASHGSVTIDGVTHQILAAINNPEQKIVGARIINAGISVLLDNGANISFTKDDNGLDSQYIDSRDFSSNAAPIDTKGLIFKDLASASQFSLQPTVFNFSNFGTEPKTQPITISAMVDAPIAQQVLTISPQSPTTNSLLNGTNIPKDFTVRLINHNTVEIEGDYLKATIRDKKLKSLKLYDLNLNLNDSSSNLSRIIEIDYQCGEGTSVSCNGVTIEPNGFGLKFNNTVLKNTIASNSNDSEPLPPSIKLNGGLVYLGR